MYLLDSHLSREQSQLLTAVQDAAGELGIALYLTGGAMRDMLGGFPIRDLDFTFEGQPPTALAKLIGERLPGIECIEDTLRKVAELRLPSGVSASLRMAHVQKVSKPGGTPKITAANLLEDLAQRDFTVNAIAISLAKASRGLIRDPRNGVSDLQNREIRVTYPQAFFDEPVRMVRAVRLRHRLGFQMEERTQRYFATGVEEGWIKTLTPADWAQELHLVATEREPSEILAELEASQLLPIDPGGLNLAGLGRWEKLRRMIPGRGAEWLLFLQVLTEEMKTKERTTFFAAFGIDPAEWEAGRKLKPRAAKLEAALKSPALRRPSQVYNALCDAPLADILTLLYESSQRIVQERLRNYLEKYLQEASEITDAQVELTGAKPGTAQFRKAKTALIAARLNAPIPQTPPDAPATPSPVPAGGAPARIAR